MSHEITCSPIYCQISIKPNLFDNLIFGVWSSYWLLMNWFILIIVFVLYHLTASHVILVIIMMFILALYFISSLLSFARYHHWFCIKYLSCALLFWLSYADQSGEWRMDYWRFMMVKKIDDTYAAMGKHRH